MNQAIRAVLRHFAEGAETILQRAEQAMEAAMHEEAAAKARWPTGGPVDRARRQVALIRVLVHMEHESLRRNCRQLREFVMETNDSRPDGNEPVTGAAADAILALAKLHLDHCEELTAPTGAGRPHHRVQELRARALLRQLASSIRASADAR